MIKKTAIAAVLACICTTFVSATGSGGSGWIVIDASASTAQLCLLHIRGYEGRITSVICDTMVALPSSEANPTWVAVDPEGMLGCGPTLITINFASGDTYTDFLDGSWFGGYCPGESVQWPPSLPIVPPFQSFPTNPPVVNTDPPTGAPTLMPTTSAPTVLPSPEECVVDWAQCGGQDWAAGTCCLVPTSKCNVLNAFYSECQPPPSSTVGPILPPPAPICSAAGQQCGGSTWGGFTCCTAGNVCEDVNKYYSKCVAIPPAGATCMATFKQCGGLDWRGPTTCCDAAAVCYETSVYYSQCRLPANIPTTTTSPQGSVCGTEGAQCGGTNWFGSTCCLDGYHCKWKTDYYSKCIKDAPPVVGCAAIYQQCGGADWEGAVCCVDGTTCTKISPFYYQCLKPTATPPTPPAKDERFCANLHEVCGAPGATWQGPTWCCDTTTKCVLDPESGVSTCESTNPIEIWSP